ncbi:hypothetical protein X801_08403, partial [Opisthorchis viverrini]
MLLDLTILGLFITRTRVAEPLQWNGRMKHSKFRRRLAILMADPHFSVRGGIGQSENSNDPAIIACRLGRGWGILSGVHFEYDPKLLYEDDPTVHVKRVCDELWVGNECRIELVRQLVGNLLNPDSNLVSDLP